MHAVTQNKIRSLYSVERLVNAIAYDSLKFISLCSRKIPLPISSALLFSPITRSMSFSPLSLNPKMVIWGGGEESLIAQILFEK